jgi:hypothetical protein
MNAQPEIPAVSREALIHALYEAAELEHNLMCTYLYAAFSLKSGRTKDSAPRKRCHGALAPRDPARGRRGDGTLTAVWNITSALGGRRASAAELPAGSRRLPASVVVRLAPFSEAVLQHFIFLERPAEFGEPDGAGFDRRLHFPARRSRPRVTPMPVDYETVGDFYVKLSNDLKAFVARLGEKAVFCGDARCRSRAPRSTSRVATRSSARSPRSRPSTPSSRRAKARRRKTRTRTTAASSRSARSSRAQGGEPVLRTAHPAAVNPVLRRPVRPACACGSRTRKPRPTVDIANTAYMLMLRLISHSYLIPQPHPAKRCASTSVWADARHGAARRARGAPARRTLAIRAAMPACRSRRCAMRAPFRRAPAPERFFTERSRSCWPARGAAGAVEWRRARRAMREHPRDSRRRPSAVRGRRESAHPAPAPRAAAPIPAPAAARRPPPSPAAAGGGAGAGTSSQAMWRPRRAPSTVSTTSKDATSR